MEPPKMSVLEYLGQTEWWLDVRSGQSVQVLTMDTEERLYAARWLIRHATAVISLAEVELYQYGQLLPALALAARNPRDWIQGTSLYGALYQSNEPARHTESPAEAMSRLAFRRERRG